MTYYRGNLAIIFNTDLRLIISRSYSEHGTTSPRLNDAAIFHHNLRTKKNQKRKDNITIDVSCLGI